MSALVERSVFEANLASVRTRIASACRAAGRREDEVTLVAVTKTWPAAVVAMAYDAGLRDFGENYVQELSLKQSELEDREGLRWHVIGHLQRNKARMVAPYAAMVQSVDSASLATELGARAEKAGRVLPVLVQVNVGGEAQKSGCALEEAASVMDAVDAAKGLRLAGLMTVPPHTDDAEGARPFFERLMALREASGGVARLPVVSMGMTHDLDVAIACGATMVRVGSALFGTR